MDRQSYAGPGVWIRIQHRFGPRMTEWFLAGHTALWGLVLIYSDDLFNQPAWTGFRGLFGDSTLLGWVMMMLGLIRICGLIVNGARKDVTPVIRQVSAGIGFFLWAGITYGYASSGVLSTWLAIYPLFAIGELVNINRAAHDQGEARNGRSDKLPLPLLIAMGLGLAVILAVRYFGLMSGEKASPEKAASYAQVASVIVDPAALNKLTEQGVKLVAVLEDMVDQAKEKIRVDGLMATELDRIREELRIQREISRR